MNVDLELRDYILERYDDIVNAALYNFALYIQYVQDDIVKSFHASQNAFVAEKMFVRPGVLNLSNVGIPMALSNYLSDGIKYVPNAQLGIYGYHNIMQEDLRGHLMRVFYNLLGFWPYSNKLSSFVQFCNELLVQCTCNHVFCTFIYNIMVTYLNVVAPKGFPIDLRETLVSAVPEGYILTISDKGLGPVLLP